MEARSFERGTKRERGGGTAPTGTEGWNVVGGVESSIDTMSGCRRGF